MSTPFSDKLYFGIPSRNSTMDISSLANIIFALGTLEQEIQLEHVDCVVQASNIPRARNAIMDQFGRPNDKMFMMWVDDDMIIRSHVDIVNSIKLAMSMEESIVVVPYHMSTPPFESTIRKYRRIRGEGENPQFEPKKEIEYLDEKGCAGLGFAVGWFPSKYLFHADEIGEDVYFWCEHPHIPMVVDSRWTAGHRKEIII